MSPAHPISISNHRNRTVGITSADAFVHLFIAVRIIRYEFNEVKSLYHPLQSIHCSLFIPNSIKGMEQIIEIPRI